MWDVHNELSTVPGNNKLGRSSRKGIANVINSNALKRLMNMTDALSLSRFLPPSNLNLSYFKCAICHNNIIVNRPVTTLSGELLCRESISNTLEAGKMKICSVHMHSHAFHYTHIYTSFRCCIERGVITTLWEAYLLSSTDPRKPRDHIQSCCKTTTWPPFAC